MLNAVLSSIKNVSNDLIQKNNILLSSNNNGHGNVGTKGKPNSTVKKPNGDLRSYGPDGRATKDTDYSHPKRHPNLKNPHEHDWTWDVNGVPHRGDAHNFQSLVSKIGEGIGVGVIGYAMYRGIRMLPSLLPALWWSMPANIAVP